jgi:2-polyprenyl-3-methyl-5-hydroxy-6-metoxy-1,4-benzoquinol methylase
MAIEEAKLNEFLGKVVGDAGAAVSAPLMLIGDRLGLYKAMAGAGPLTSEQLAKKTGTTERYVREWLANQAAGGIVTYDPKKGTYTLPEVQAFCLADETSPAFLPGLFQVIVALAKDVDKIADAFKSGEGVAWGAHDAGLFEGTERFFAAGYRGNLLSSWIPALDGVEAKLKKGATVADVGCGHGASTLIMAKAFPTSKFTGFDNHEPSIVAARERAKKAGLSNVRFETGAAQDYAGKDLDFVAVFDCLHDMGDPVGAAAHVKKTLKPDGTWMIVEPFAGDRLEENLNPVGRLYYGASSLVCTPASLAQKGRMGLGAQAGEAKIKDVATKGGFTRFRRATQTPFNLILEARP